MKTASEKSAAQPVEMALTKTEKPEKLYTPPRLLRYGTIQSLTKAGTGSASEAENSIPSQAIFYYP